MTRKYKIFDIVCKTGLINALKIGSVVIRLLMVEEKQSVGGINFHQKEENRLEVIYRLFGGTSLTHGTKSKSNFLHASLNLAIVQFVYRKFTKSGQGVL